MALALVCACGARFDVEDRFAGQSVACPECQRAVTAVAQLRQPLRTSGFAIASVVLSLVLAFTLVGTILAVFLGAIGLVHIRRHRDRVAGTGYAVLGMSLGVLFTALFLFALFSDLVGMWVVREATLGSQVDRGGPMEISQAGFSIRRPTPQWGVANDEMRRDQSNDSELLLVNLSKDAYLDVSSDTLGGRTLEAYKDAVLDTYKEQRNPMGKRDPLSFRGLTVKHTEPLPAEGGREGIEVQLEVRIGAQPLTFLLHIVRAPGSDRVFLLRGWASKRRFPLVEKEIRETLTSFRILK